MLSRIIIILLALFAVISAQSETSTADTLIGKKVNFLAYPTMFYTPETQLAFGFGTMVYFRTSSTTEIRPSKFYLSAYYTTNNQYQITFAPVIYFPGITQDIFDLLFTYTNEVAKFYGVGNQTAEIDNPDYKMKSLRFYSEFGSKNLFIKDLHTGILFDYSTNTVYDKQSNPYLLTNSITGHGGGVLMGLGVLLVLDLRDNIFYPSENYYYKFRWKYYGKGTGSDFNYNRLVFDLRHYFSIWPTHIVALNLYGDITTGSPPFFRLPALGGDEHMRGFFYGRYRDHHYLTGQVEYRKIVWWRLGTAFFFSAGDVAPRLREFNLVDLKYSYGFGLRYVFDKEEKVNVRMDLGFGKNTGGIYFALEEAF